MKNLSKEKDSPTILVVGATGMLGKIVFNFLKTYYPKTVWGTVRKNPELKKNLILLNTDSFSKDFNFIFKRLEKIDYVINCAAIINEAHEITRIIEVNSFFPHQLEKLSYQYNFKLIHVSTDAVFSNKSKKVTEKSAPCAESIYAASKLLGEVLGKNSITIRTSLLGSYSTNKDSFFQWALKKKAVNGFINQKWSGSTTLQFAKLCYFLSQKQNFNKLRKKSAVYHFTPLSNTTKYNILFELSKIRKDIIVTKANCINPITRNLTSQYFDKNFLSSYTTNTNKALRELFEFENLINHD